MTTQLRKPQIRVLKVLAKGRPLTRGQIAEKAEVDEASLCEHLGSRDDATRIANDRKHWMSLISLRAVRQEMHDVNGRDTVLYSITQIGVKLYKKTLQPV